MKKENFTQILFALILFFSGYHLIGQNFHPFPDEKVRVYKSIDFQGPFLYGFELKGTEPNANGELLLLNPNTIVYQYEFDFSLCLYNSGNWWAEEVTIESDKIVLTLSDGTEIVLNTGLNPGEFGDTTSTHDGFMLSAEVQTIEEEDTPAGRDTAITFVVHAFDPGTGDTAGDHIFQGAEVTIGRTLGLMETFPFNGRTLGPYNMWSSWTDMSLESIFENADEIRPHYLDFFPFEAGDELHILSTSTTGPPDNSETKEKFLFTGREFDPQTGVLSLDYIREMVGWSNYFGDVTTYEKRDTGVWRIGPDKWLDLELPPGFEDLVPGEPLIVEDSHGYFEVHTYTYTSAEDSKFDRKVLSFYDDYLIEESFINCQYAFQSSYDSFIRNRFFIDGMGGGYYYLDDHQGSSIREPAYVSTATLEWGTPFEFTVNVSEEPTSEAPRLFPNPATDHVVFKIDNHSGVKPVSVNIYDAMGHNVHYLQWQEGSDRFRWDSSAIPAGMYFYRLISSTGDEYSGKIILH